MIYWEFLEFFFIFGHFPVNSLDSFGILEIHSRLLMIPVGLF